MSEMRHFTGVMLCQHCLLQGHVHLSQARGGFHQSSSTDQAVFSTGIYNCLEQTRWALMQTMRCHQMFVWLEWETNANQL